jgi:hypothetical protein
VISGLRNAARGTKLAFKENTGRFVAHASERYFGDPIREFFAMARSKIGQDVAQQQFNDAVAGLRELRNTYANKKLAALNRVIEDAELGMRRDDQRSLNLRSRHPTYLIIGFSQRIFLPENNLGVCYACDDSSRCRSSAARSDCRSVSFLAMLCCACCPDLCAGDVGLPVRPRTDAGSAHMSVSRSACSSSTFVPAASCTTSEQMRVSSRYSRRSSPGRPARSTRSSRWSGICATSASTCG